MEEKDQLPNAPYGIICSIHGKQGISKENYELQMSLVDSTWQCPLCDHEIVLESYVRWDDERYEKSQGWINDEAMKEDIDWDEVKGDLDYHERKENGEL